MSRWTAGRSAPRRGQNLLQPILTFFGSNRRQAKDRRHLVRLFEWKGCEDAEELADETLRRVSRRIEGMEMESVNSYTYLREELTHRVFREVLQERTRREVPSRRSAGRSVKPPQPKSRFSGSPPAQGLSRGFEHVEDLFDPETRRMDIGRLSAYLEVPRDRLEALAKRGSQASEALPRSSGPAPLSSIQRSLEILEQVLIGREAVLAWLRSPHPDLGQRPPLEVILQGYPDAVEDMLEAALEGIPS